MSIQSNPRLLLGARLLRVAVLAVFVVAGQGRAGEWPGPGALNPSLPRCMAPVDVGIERASDIESAVIKFASGDTYGLTFKDCPEATTQLYKALLDLGSLEWKSTGGDNDLLVLNSKSGNTATLVFWTDRLVPDRVRYNVNGTYHSDALDTFLNSLRKDAKAASLGAHIPFKVGALEVGLPSKPLARVGLSSKEGKAVLAKARSIIDCLDIRGTLPERVDAEVALAIAKFGAVVLWLDEPVTLNLYEPKDTPPPHSEGGYGLGIKRKEFLCDAILVMSYGNLMPPAVILRNERLSYRLFRSSDLTRRKQEKRGVTEYGLPGHPVTDKAYYKSPAELYRQLQELMKVAYKKGKAMPRTEGAYPFDRFGFPARK